MVPSYVLLIKIKYKNIQKKKGVSKESENNST